MRTLRSRRRDSHQALMMLARRSKFLDDAQSSVKYLERVATTDDEGCMQR